MFNVSLHRTQHRQLVLEMEELRAHLAASARPSDATQLRSRLSRFSSSLSEHGHALDLELYPRILERWNPAACARAEALSRRFSVLNGAFRAYLHLYIVENQMQTIPSSFEADTEGLFQALKACLQFEEPELFDLLESAPSVSTAQAC